jgi:hypothetical protein
VRIQDYSPTRHSDKTIPPDNSIPRDLPPIKISPSVLWKRLQFVIALCFVNVGFLAIIPYLISRHSLSSQVLLLILWLSINGLVWSWHSCKKQSDSVRQISVKRGIWILEIENRKYYCELSADILCWQWILIIPLYSAESRCVIRLVILQDSISAEENSILRRWIHSECG